MKRKSFGLLSILGLAFLVPARSKNEDEMDNRISSNTITIQKIKELNLVSLHRYNKNL